MAQIYRHAEWRKCNHISKALGHKGVATNSAAQNCPAPFPPTDFGTAPDSNFNLQVGQVVCQAPLAAQLWPGGFAHRQSYCNLNKARNGRMVGGSATGNLELDSSSDCQMSARDSGESDGGGDDSWLCSPSPPRSPLAMVFTAWHTFADSPTKPPNPNPPVPPPPPPKCPLLNQPAHFFARNA